MDLLPDLLTVTSPEAILRSLHNGVKNMIEIVKKELAQVAAALPGARTTCTMCHGQMNMALVPHSDNYNEKRRQSTTENGISTWVITC